MDSKTSGRIEKPTGFVYFVQGCRSGLIKIGRATDWRARLSAIRSQSPEPIRLLSIIETPLPTKDEARLHEQFSDRRHHGEWFTPSAEMFRVMKRRGSLPLEEWNPTFCQIRNGARRFASIRWNLPPVAEG